VAFNAQFSATTAALTAVPDILPAKPIEYHIPERAKVVRFTCSPGDDLSDREQLRWRIEAIDAKSTIKQEESEGMVNESGEDAKDYFPMVCRPTQYLFYLGNDRLPYLHRIFEYAKPNRMINKVGKHLESFA